MALVAGAHLNRNGKRADTRGYTLSAKVLPPSATALPHHLSLFLSDQFQSNSPFLCPCPWLFRHNHDQLWTDLASTIDPLCSYTDNHIESKETEKERERHTRDPISGRPYIHIKTTLIDWFRASMLPTAAAVTCANKQINTHDTVAKMEGKRERKKIRASR